MDDEFFMQLALHEAELSIKEDLLPVGCVIVFDNDVVAKSHKVKEFHKWLDHAETVAIRQALEKFKTKEDQTKLTVYTTLEPCSMCFGTINHTRIGRLVFALEDPYGGAVDTKFNAPRHQIKPLEITSGILRNKSIELFRKYFENTQEVFWQNKDNPLVKLVCKA